MVESIVRYGSTCRVVRDRDSWPSNGVVERAFGDTSTTVECIVGDEEVSRVLVGLPCIRVFTTSIGKVINQPADDV